MSCIIALNRTGTDTVSENGMALNFTAGTGNGGEVFHGLSITTTSNTTTATDLVTGLNIGNLVSADSADEQAIRIGANWDASILFGDTTTNLQIINGGTITWEDDAGNDLDVHHSSS